MKLKNEFSVPASVDTVWHALLDPDRVAPCFPGATITSADGDEFAGLVKVRLGPISLQYRGSGRFTETDEAAHRAVIEATGTASGGQSTAAATVTATLAENGGGTAVTLVTDLTVTGKPAQFGRGMIEDVGGKIIGQFADCLAESLAPQEVLVATAAEPPAAPALSATSASPVRSAPSQLRVLPATPSATEEIDLLDAASGAVAKRVVPTITALAVLALLIWRWRRRC
ncbi:MAG TPA: SRPBCC family protein [Pseudonocardiaceae bacterium]|nr:SRPBCC family protein [Pseudonocardiaceae bacterium]